MILKYYFTKTFLGRNEKYEENCYDYEEFKYEVSPSQKDIENYIKNYSALSRNEKGYEQDQHYLYGVKDAVLELMDYAIDGLEKDEAFVDFMKDEYEEKALEEYRNRGN